MPTPEERLSLVLEASDKATAILQRVRKEIEATRDASDKGGKKSEEMGERLNALSNTTPRLKDLGAKLSSVAFAIDAARLGTKDAVIGLGSLAAGAAEVTPAFAAWAGPIGGAVALLGTALAIVMDTRQEEEALAHFREHTQGKSLETLQQINEQTRQAKDRTLKVIQESDVSLLERALGYVDILSGRITAASVKTLSLHGLAAQLDHQLAQSEIATTAVTAAQQAEGRRLSALQRQTVELIAQRGIARETAQMQLEYAQHSQAQFAVERQAAAASLQSANLAVDAMFRHVDAQDHIVKLTAKEEQERERLKGINQELYDLAVRTARTRAQDREADATRDYHGRITALRQEVLIQQGLSTSVVAQHEAIDEAQAKEAAALSRSGASLEFQAVQGTRMNAIYEKQHQLVELIAARMVRTAHADRLANSDNPAEALQGRMEQIRLEQEAEEAAHGNKVEAAANAEQKKRQLIRQTFDATANSLKSIEDLTANSDNARTKAAHNFAKNYRAVIIGAKAAEAAVDSARAFASIPEHLAVQDYSGAALAALAGTQLAAAAVIGFHEAGGGSASGGGGAGGSGGGSATGSSNTFTPGAALEASQPLVVNLYTLHPSDPQLVDSIAFEMRKGELLKRPQLQSPPAIALGASAGR